ncbi:MAG: HAMP domain-containing protein [Epsilonproteobacteria bacterium]|nr:HAMP domain-containing protein [Campylobacterota bacterium]
MKIKKISLSIKIALLVMIVSFFGIATLAYISYDQSKKIFTDHTAQILAKNIDQYTNFIRENIQKLRYNITIFSYNPSVKGFMRSYFNKYKYDEKTNKTFSQYKKDIIAMMLFTMKQNPAYFQMRIIDATNGEEIVKLIRNNNQIQIAKPHLLQNKWNRNYVQQTLKKRKGCYISHINLNKEFHTIEYPIKPTIRIAKVIYANGKKAGIAVINADIKKLFDFDKLIKANDSTTFIANEEGYYLFNPIHPEREFGFEFGREYKIFSRYPELKEFFTSKDTTFSYICYKNDKILEARKVFIYPDRFIVVLKTTTSSVFQNKAKAYTKNLIISIILITLIITLITTILVRILTSPIRKLTAIANKIARNKGAEHYNIDINTNDEIGELAHSFDVMLSAIEESKKELEKFAEKLEEEVEKKTKQLQEVNKNLQKIVEEKVKELRQKDQALVQQSKMAAMGEMIGAIAHQWRQPLNSLAINIQMLEDMADNDELTPEVLHDFIDKNMQTIEFMSNTIDDFRNFFRKDKEAVRFNVKEAIEKTINLQRAQLSNHNIEVITDLQDGYTKGFKNEFMQVILNLISNAKDAIEEYRAKTNNNFKGKIYIQTKPKDDKILIIMRDNGGGIEPEVANRIFEPYFTTKDEGKGTGMGLYMVREIINRMNGSIKVSNAQDGAEFIIELPKDDDEN